MRRFALIPVAALSLLALISACATSPDEGLGATTEETKSAEPAPGDTSVKLPPKSTTNATADAGTADSAKPDTGSSTSSSGSSGTSSSGSSGTSSSSSSSSGSSGAVGPACDLSNTLKVLLYQVEVSNQSSPVPCPCAATKCCYLGVTCIDP